MEDTEISLKLTVAQLNVILGVLGDAPFRVAQPLIQTIQEQASPQLTPAEPEAAAPKKA